MLGEAVAELTHIQHGYLFTLPSSVHSERQIAQLTIGHSDERVTGGSDTGGLGHLHRKVFQFRQAGVLAALRLENILAPEAHDGEF